MFYENFNNDKKIKYSKNFLKEFKGLNTDIDAKILSLNSSPMTYNFDFSNGVLKDGMGLESLNFRYLSADKNAFKVIDDTPDDSFIEACWLFTAWSTEFDIHRPFLIVYTSRGDFYYNRLHSVSSELIKIEGLHCEFKPIIASYNVDGIDSLIIVSKEEGMYIWQYPTTVRKIESAPSISSMCVHNNMLFVTTYGEKREILYSKNLDPTAFTLDAYNSGVLRIHDQFGKCNKVVSFEGYLFVIRDFNIAKVSFYDRDNYNIEQLYISDARIYENTVCICGDKIIYLASDGLYSFDGNKAKKIKLNIDSLFNGVDNSDAIAEYCNGYYYLSCRLNYADDVVVDDESLEYFVNNAFIRINVETSEMLLMRGKDVIGIYVINDVFRSEVCLEVREKTGICYVGKLNMSGKYFDKKITKVWNSPNTDFGDSSRLKFIKQISLETKQDITIQIKTENKEKNFKVKGKAGIQSIKPYIKGKRFSFNFISEESNNHISSPTIVVGYL